jgi:radical SAM superfamily enzyme YgiQ (UPF0313 family)
MLTTNMSILYEDLRSDLDDILAPYGYNRGCSPDGVVFLHIPQVPSHVISQSIAENLGYFVYPPHGLLYLSAVLENNGVSSRIADLNRSVLIAGQDGGKNITRAWQAEVQEAIAVYERPLVAISFMFDSTRAQLNEVMAFVKKTHPKLCVVVGGVAATGDPEAVLRTGHGDIVFHNEGEGPLIGFFDLINNSRAKIPDNISFLAKDGSLRQSNIVSGGEVDFDIREQYKKIDVGQYHKAGSLNNFSRMRGTDVPFATVLSRRGCRANCTFCAVRNFNGRSVRVRQVPGVIEEMEFLWHNHGVRHFEWLDDDLLYDRNKSLNLFNEISTRLPDATWCANNGLIAAAISEELLEAMEKSGCQGFTVGLETGNAEMLRKVRKPASLERFAKFSDMSKKFPKIYYIVNFILGLPDERFSQMLDTLAVGAKAELDWINFFTYQPLKNTDAYLAYGGMDLQNYEDIIQRGTTINFNPVRDGAFMEIGEKLGIARAYDIFDLEADLIPSREQVKEVWFTFNAICNFLRNPALFTTSYERVRNTVRWLEALQQAYADNPTITCVLYYLNWRLNETGKLKLEALKDTAKRKFSEQEYWRIRDKTFSVKSFLDKDISPLDPRAEKFFNSRGFSMQGIPVQKLEVGTR